eukprot:s6882_g2.t1
MAASAKPGRIADGRGTRRATTTKACVGVGCLALYARAAQHLFPKGGGLGLLRPEPCATFPMERLVNLSSVARDAEAQASKDTADDYFVLEAEAVIAKALARLEAPNAGTAALEAAKELRSTPVFAEVQRVSTLYDSARATLQPTRFKQVWARPDAEFYVRSAPRASWFEYKIVAQIDHPLVNCMAPLHERELILKYQPVFVEPHRDLIPPKPHHAIVRTLARILSFYVETIFELIRVSNKDFGYLVEIARSDFPTEGRDFRLPRRRFWSKSAWPKNSFSYKVAMPRFEPRPGLDS